MREDAARTLRQYERQAGQLSHQEAGYSWSRQNVREIPANYQPAWMGELRSPIFGGSVIRQCTLEDLFLRALRHSTKIKVLSDTPLIRETGIREAKGDFDAIAFIEGKYSHTQDPLATDSGLLLTPDYWTSDTYSVRSGVSKKLASGGKLELTQDLTRLKYPTRSGGNTIDPNPQATARLTLSFVQPLLKGAGTSYNLARVNIAKIDSQIARSEFIRESESHLVQINRAYWELFSARATYQQKKRLVVETEKIVKNSEARKNVDVTQGQILRSRSALAERKADLIRVETTIRNAQDRILALVNDPELTSQPRLELVPSDALLLAAINPDLEAAAIRALWHRPEVDQALLQIREAAIQEKVAKNDLMPSLNLILGGYVSGIKTKGDILGAVGQQNRDESPGVVAGFRFEIPIGNNTERAKFDRQRLITRQRLNELRLTIETILLETKVAVREVKTSYRDMQAKYETAVAAGADLRNIEARRTLILGFDEVSAVNYIEYFLDAQERESRAHEAMIGTFVAYRIALVELERTKGNLLSYSDVVRVPETKKKLPTITLKPSSKLLRATVPLRSE